MFISDKTAQHNDNK